MRRSLTLLTIAFLSLGVGACGGTSGGALVSRTDASGSRASAGMPTSPSGAMTGRTGLCPTRVTPRRTRASGER